VSRANESWVGRRGPSPSPGCSCSSAVCREPAAAALRAHAEKLTTYESGVDPVGSGWAQTQVRYYLYAFLYVVFAVDAVYLFPG
jgi:NADH:ubiquinone oxidoreductase subunit 3 (subunit A)